jgi:hypothetical protein
MHKNPILALKEYEETQEKVNEEKPQNLKIFKMKGDTEKNIKIEKNIVKDKAYHIEMDSFHSGEDSFNARHKLLNLKVAPMFLDN